MPKMKTPGVYIEEKNAFPNSIVQVATAVPAFVGYTEFAKNDNVELTNIPFRITSYTDYLKHFGDNPFFEFSLATVETSEPSDLTQDDTAYSVTQTRGLHLLSRSLQLFFQNGGGACYIVSVGGYLNDDQTENLPSADQLIAGIELLKKEREPTLLVIPDTMLLNEAECKKVQLAMIDHCAKDMRNRFAILDILHGDQARDDERGDCVKRFRDSLAINELDFAAAYYPWLNTTIVQKGDLNLEMLAAGLIIKKILLSEMGKPSWQNNNNVKSITQMMNTIWKDSDEDVKNAENTDDKTINQNSFIDLTQSSPVKELTAEELITLKKNLHNTLIAMFPIYASLFNIIQEKLNVLPPAAAMAGIYTVVDNSRGVWKAPANISVNSVVSPCANITHEQQENLNVSTTGKSINAIRPFTGEGTLVWGARTLDGNSLDWRYINVRRTMIMLEESMRLAINAYIFEPNEANTWVTVKSMINNFLTGIWKSGGLTGTIPEDAFSVHVGLGETMTSIDILEGNLRVTVLVAITRPAEFIEISFSQQMQKS